ncbi:hypothetical protein [Microvirga subterranea]|uniref:Uncharacterized protein n=1 Tax=Microvirga subterranea TaxID=186651 RepID=A0A370HJM7_9HYPH|nr:hypothetical protein [Microvirga subterranea]RDI58560.1 hypothetical protein DES45_10583 [Microvirga subterranea]
MIEISGSKSEVEHLGADQSSTSTATTSAVQLKTIRKLVWRQKVWCLRTFIGFEFQLEPETPAEFEARIEEWQHR